MTSSTDTSLVFDAAQVCAFMDAPLSMRQWCSLHDFARERDGTIRLSPHESGSDGRVILAELLDGDGAVVEARPLPYENLPPLG